MVIWYDHFQEKCSKSSEAAAILAISSCDLSDTQKDWLAKKDVQRFDSLSISTVKLKEQIIKRGL